jgi:hypothetical protein
MIIGKSSLLLLLASVLPGQSMHLALLTGSSEFFSPIIQGWYDECSRLDTGEGDVICEDILGENGSVDGKTCFRLNATDETEGVTCEHIVDQKRGVGFNITRDKKHCVALTRWLIEKGDVDAIAARCQYRPGMPPIIQDAKDAGIPMVVFGGSHDGLGPYVSSVGTNSVNMGRIVARLLKQLRPEGGTYLATYNEANSAERFHGFKEEIEKDNDRDDKAHWTEAPINYTELNPQPEFSDPLAYTGPHVGWDNNGFRGITRLGYDGIPMFLDIFHRAKPTAIVFLYQTPMRHENYTDFVDAHRHLNISYVSIKQ